MDLFHLATLQDRMREDELVIVRACNVAKKRITPLLRKHGIADSTFGVEWDKVMGAVLVISYYRGNRVTGRDGMVTLKIPQGSLYDAEYIEAEIIRKAN